VYVVGGADVDDGTLVVGGSSFGFDVNEGVSPTIEVDLDNSGNWAAGFSVPIVTEGGYIIDLGQDQTPNGNDVVASLTTLGKRFDAGVYDGVSDYEQVQVTIDDGNTVADVSVAPVALKSLLEMQSVEGQDLKRGMTKYGALFELTDSSDANDADDLTITYPLAERGALVYVVGGVAQSSRTGSSKGTVETVVIEKINVGAAKLDSEISNVWAQNLVLVGGPCANQAALEVMGVSAGTCADGFMEGKAMIKLYENSGKVAMVVAGYSAMDTRRATRVLADYAKYKTEMVGTEVEVAGTTLADITVSQAR
jgi:hypothetical protein